MTDRINGVYKDLITLTAKATVHEALKGLGADVENPLDMQADFQHLRKSREGVEQTRRIIKKSGLGALVTIVIPAAIYALWEAFKGGLSR